MLVASLGFNIGCYNTAMVSKDELKARVEQVDISILTNDSLEYKFSKGNYRIQGDTLSGYGIRRGNVTTDVVLDASLPFAQVHSIEIREFDLAKTIFLCAGIGLGGVLLYTLLFRHDAPPTFVGPGIVAVSESSH